MFGVEVILELDQEIKLKRKLQVVVVPAVEWMSLDVMVAYPNLYCSHRDSVHLVASLHLLWGSREEKPQIWVGDLDSVVVQSRLEVSETEYQKQSH